MENQVSKIVNLVVGNDNGNSEHDIIINGELIKQPNVYAKVRKLPMLEELNEEYVIEHIEDNLIVTVNSTIADLGIYIVGKNALQSGEKIRSIEVGVDNNKIDSNIVFVNTLSQIAGYACKKAFNDNDKSFVGLESIIAKVDMATALPISQYSKESAKIFADKFMNGDHNITVNIGTRRINVTVIFGFVKVIPEGVTTVFALQNASVGLFDEYNKSSEGQPIDQIDSKFFKNAKVLHVAIGEGTTEYPVTKGIEFNPNFITGSNNGIGHAIDKSIDEFKGALGLATYSRQNFSEILKNEAHKYYAVAEDIASGYIEEQAEEIEHYAKTQVQRANNEIDIVAVYGGGSILMRSHLEKRLKAFCDRAMIKLFYVPKNFAVTLEVSGLYNFAISDIFNKLKKIQAPKK